VIAESPTIAQVPSYSILIYPFQTDASFLTLIFHKVV